MSTTRYAAVNAVSVMSCKSRSAMASLQPVSGNL